MPDGIAPQFSDLTEATIPAAALMVKGFFESAGKLPEPEDFEDNNLAQLWEAILAVHKRKVAVTKISVQRELKEMGWPDDRAFAAMKATEAPYLRMEEALAAVKEVLDRRLRRQAMRVVGEALNELKTVHNVQELVARTERAMSDLASQAADSDHWISVADVSEERTERLPTGIADLDRVNGGLPVAELTIGAGRTGMGKSAFAATLMLNVASEGYGVAAFSLEMRGSPLLHRMAAAEAYEHARMQGGRSPNPFYDAFEQGTMQKDHLKRFLAARQRVQKLPIRIDQRRGLALNQIRLGARRARMLFDREGIPLKLLVVDHIGKIRPDRTTGNRHLDLGEITETLAVIAGELDCAVFGLAQLTREVEREQDKRPMLHHLRESGRIEEDAHTIVLFYRPAYYDERNKDRGDDPSPDEHARITRERFVMEVDIAKNRGGAIKRVPLFCEIQANAILSRDDPRVPVDAMGGEI